MRPDSLPSRIVAILKARGPMSRPALEYAIEGYEARSVHAALYGLRRRGLVVQLRRASRYRKSLYGLAQQRLF